LILSTAVSVILGVLSFLDFGLPQGLWLFLAAYGVFLVTWLVIRGPTVYRNLWNARRRRQLLAMKRAALVAEVEQRRTRGRKPSSDGSCEGTKLSEERAT